jgi:hypothetical protein
MALKNPSQFLLSINKPFCPQVYPVGNRKIERKKAWCPTMKEKIAKLWSAAFIDTDNFTIDYGLARKWECHLFAQV